MNKPANPLGNISAEHVHHGLQPSGGVDEHQRNHSVVKGELPPTPPPTSRHASELRRQGLSDLAQKGTNMANTEQGESF